MKIPLRTRRPAPPFYSGSCAVLIFDGEFISRRLSRKNARRFCWGTRFDVGVSSRRNPLITAGLCRARGPAGVYGAAGNVDASP